MKVLLSIVVLAALAVGGFYAFNSYIYNEKQGDSMPAPNSTTPPEVTPIEHASGILSWDGTTIYFDPVGATSTYAGKPAAQIILITDIHGDHFSSSTIESLMRDDTALVVPQAVRDQLPEALAARAIVLNNGQVTTQRDFKIEAIPMYNTPGAENADFHTKGRGNGYLIEHNAYRVYIAGDTAATPEMAALQNVGMAFIPMNLPYTMSVEEAAQAVLGFKPKIVYPYHYRGPDGLADVNQFKSLVNAGNPDIQVVLGAWYPLQ